MFRDKLLDWLTDTAMILFVIGTLMLIVPFVYMCFLHEVNTEQLVIGIVGLGVIVFTFLLILLALILWCYDAYRKSRK